MLHTDSYSRLDIKNSFEFIMHIKKYLRQGQALSLILITLLVEINYKPIRSIGWH